MNKLPNNWNKQQHDKITEDKNAYKPTEDHIAQMSKAMSELCKLLSKDYDEFDKKHFFEKFSIYIKNNNNRLLYTNVTNEIFNNYNSTGSFQSNLENVIAYSYEIKCSGVKAQIEHEKVQRALMKLWDHINLAIRQYELFQISDEHYSAIAEEKMKNVEIRLTKEMNMQLLSLIAIFTALSFIVFGGITSLDNIFEGVKDIPVTKLMIVGCIWCLCIMNLVFVFLFFVSKLTGLEFKSTTDPDANLVQKYPLICWCNWVIITILVFSCWAYYIKCEEYSQKISIILQQYSTVYFIVGTLLISVLVIIGANIIYQLYRGKETQL